MIRNIIFDVGKVLVEWDCVGVFRSLGFGEDALEAVAEATVLSSDWGEMDRSALGDEELLAHFIGKLPGYEREMRLFWDNIGQTISCYGYTRGWIRALREKGYRVYILSNYARWTYQNTKQELSFLEDVDGSLFSFEIKKIKPEPEIYLALLERYGLRPEECVFLDDRQENIDAALALGIRGVLFTGFGEAVRRLAEEYGVRIQSIAQPMLPNAISDDDSSLYSKK